MKVAELARLVLPRGCRDGSIIVLTAYFDDSGTHDGSPIVSMGGLKGTEDEWLVFEAAWAAKLAAPLPGKPHLKRFHMYDCEHGVGEFAGYNRAERDRVTFEFRQVIIDAKLWAYSSAVSRKDWDELIVGDTRRVVGDAELWCVNCCILKSLQWADRFSHEREMAFVFDDRPHRQKANQRIFGVYHRFFSRDPGATRPTGIAFLNSEKTLPLQGADMVAWEFHRDAEHWLKDGSPRNRRAHLKRLVETGRVAAQLADRASILQIAGQEIDPDRLREAADHLDL